MKSAFIQSIIIHLITALTLFGIGSFSIKQPKSQTIQLSMQMTSSNEGHGLAARGIETSQNDVNINSKANALNNAENNNVVKKEVSKEDNKVKKAVQNKPKTETLKDLAMLEKRKEHKCTNDCQHDKKENHKKNVNSDNKTKTNEKASIGALMAAKGKQLETGAGNKKGDGTPKSVGGIDGVYSLKDVDNKPKSLKSVRPLYPEYAKNMRIEGRVTISFILDDKGRVINPKVVKAEPKDTFDNAALTAVKQWRFQPAKKDGKDVNVGMVISLNFKLDENK